jgi:hypothetical protein
VAGSPDKFVPHPGSRNAVISAPTAETLQRFTTIRQIGGQGRPAEEGINVKFELRDAGGKRWLFKPANGEVGMRYGTRLGIRQGQRYRRAPAAALIADRLGIPTPKAKVVVYNGQPGSLQEWWTGYEPSSKLGRGTTAADQFWDSQPRKDLDAMDYVTAQQDRHRGNIYLKEPIHAGAELAAIDQDASFPPTSDRFDPNLPPAKRDNWQRPVPDTLSPQMAARLRSLAAHWPEAELRQWLTKAEADGARVRLQHIVDELAAGRITVTP